MSNHQNMFQSLSLRNTVLRRVSWMAAQIQQLNFAARQAAALVTERR